MSILQAIIDGERVVKDPLLRFEYDEKYDTGTKEEFFLNFLKNHDEIRKNVLIKYFSEAVENIFIIDLNTKKNTYYDMNTKNYIQYTEEYYRKMLDAYNISNDIKTIDNTHVYKLCKNYYNAIKDLGTIKSLSEGNIQKVIDDLLEGNRHTAYFGGHPLDLLFGSCFKTTIRQELHNFLRYKHYNTVIKYDLPYPNKKRIKQLLNSQRDLVIFKDKELIKIYDWLDKNSDVKIFTKKDGGK